MNELLRKIGAVIVSFVIVSVIAIGLSALFGLVISMLINLAFGTHVTWVQVLTVQWILGAVVSMIAGIVKSHAAR